MSEDLQVSVSTIRERLFTERLRALHPEGLSAFEAMKPRSRSKYIEDNWARMFPPVDLALRKVVTGPIKRLVTKAMGPDADEVMRSHWEPQIKAKMHNTFEFYIIMLRFHSFARASLEEQSRLLLNYYLLLVEGVYAAQVNLICYLLSRTGIPYRSSKAMSEHSAPAGSMGAIEEDSLWNKLRFMEDNGLSFMVDACDRQLRNSVAHLDFIVFTNGCVGYGAGQRGPKVIKYEELVHKVEVMKSISDAVNEVLVEEVTAWRKASKTVQQKAAKRPSKTKKEIKDPASVLRAAALQKPKKKDEGEVRL
ncbi:MAG: hypothetical protein HPY73_08890 [Methanomassiliicoccales archaeon]|nr:MAG: hypothetical protein HPY73_08890 [Methanomassiliicoccales archaeon]